jgi:hypothetical protein
MPGGRGVNVVNTVRFDILNAGECFRDRMKNCVKDLDVEVENNVSGQGVLEVNHVQCV